MGNQESSVSSDVLNPCLDCGACCATFRVSFYWAETDEHPSGIVPSHLTSKLNSYLVYMAGTERKPVRCIALQGEVGKRVGCAIYANRSSTCREFDVYTEACNKARAVHGLAALPIRSTES